MEQAQKDILLIEVGQLLNIVPSIETAYNFAYKSLYKSTHRFGMRLLNDSFTIDNLVQEAFLKLWDYREQMTSLLHVSRFLKQNVRWECYAHFRNPVSRFHRRFTYLDALKDSDSIYELAEVAEPEDRDELTESQLKLITDMMPFLPSGRTKTFMKRYYHDSLSSRQIAERYATHVNAVHLELRHGVTQLKAMIIKPQQVLIDTENIRQTAELNQRVWLYDIEGLNREQSQIYRLRMESKYEFNQIANYLSLPQTYVQREYVKAWKVVSLQKKKTGKAATKLAATMNKQIEKPVFATFRIA